jgi:hypothetical protein
MRAKLRLVKPIRTTKAESTDREIRYRFPAHEEISEVSCDGRLPRARMTRPRPTETRRAS